MSKDLSFEILKKAVAGDTIALRCLNDLDPVGGASDKVFPPTYEGGIYARETRVIDGERLPCVLLDSVQSQANRLELSLLEWYQECPEDNKPFPLVEVDFSDTEIPEVGAISTLETPHRIVDGTFLACEYLNEKKEWIPFRHPKYPQKGSKPGQKLETASVANATPVFELCPTALLFGMWDSHGARGGLGEKFQRIIVSEIIGIDATENNVRPTSRIDPLIRTTKDMPVVKQEDGSWFLSEKGTAKLSKVGLGNVTPSLLNNKTKKENHGGVTIRFGRQITVLSLAALRRLRFPIDHGKGKELRSVDVDVAARTTIAALGLASIAYQWPNGFSLRSRCDLLPRSNSLQVTFMKHGGRPEDFETFQLTKQMAQSLVKDAAEHAIRSGLQWNTKRITLRPNPELVKTVKISREKAIQTGGD